MDVRKILRKRSLKLLTLLVTSMLIATGSAAVYYSLVMQPRVATAAAEVSFVAGGDSTQAGATGYATDGTWVRFTGLKAYPNATLTYEEAINVTNTGSDHQFRLRSGSVSTVNGTVATSNFTSITFKLIAPNGTQYGGDFTYSTTDDTWNEPADMGYIGIAAGEEWAVKVETKAASGATANILVEILIYVDIQE